MSRNDKIYSATYSNVPVYEFNVENNHVMRRRSDDWINATHILKVADYDKPARTRILEREVQKGVHEKVQGGYGKYQGTWIPLNDGRELAQKNGVLDKLRPIFDFVPGDRSPPPAPKHATASSKPRAPRAPAQPRRQPVPPRVQDYEQMDVSMQDIATPEQEDVSDSAFDDFDDGQLSSRKRRKLDDVTSIAERQHRLWADELMDYFILQEDPDDSLPTLPVPPADADLDRAIDEKGYTALHWAAAMGDVAIVKDLLRRGANSAMLSTTGETALMRAVVFTNSFDHRNMDTLATLLVDTIHMQDWSGSSVLHKIANTTERKSKYHCARYYLDTIMGKMAEAFSPVDVERVLNQPDQNGDTAVTIAARNGARKCVRALIARNADVSIANHAGETADQLIVQLNNRRHERSSHRPYSSSPVPNDRGHEVSAVNGTNKGLILDSLSSHQSLNGSASVADAFSRPFKSEAALAVASSIIPLLNDKGTSLASTMDAEVADKEAEFLEAERVADMRKTELENLRRQAEELRQKEEREQAERTFEGDERQIAALAGLIAECEELLTQEKEAELQILLEEEEARDQPPSEEQLENFDEEESVDLKLELAGELKELSSRRQALMVQLVHNLSVAGVDDKQGQYKRLITGALDLQEGDVESMLPEIVAELEEYQGMGMDGIGA